MSNSTFTLSELSSKEEVAEYLCNSLKLKDDTKNLVVNEYLSGDVIYLCTQDELQSIGFKLGPAKKISKLLTEKKDNFKEREINVKIYTDSTNEEIKNFFEKYLDFKGELKAMNGKELLELNEEGMKAIGLRIGQIKRLKRCIKYFKTLKPKVEEINQEKIDIKISRQSSEDEVSLFLEFQMHFSKEAIKKLDLDGETLLDLEEEEIDKTELTFEEKERLKKFLRDYKDLENQDKNEPESKEDKELKINRNSSSEDIYNFLKKVLSLSDNAVSTIEEQDLDGESFFDLNENENEIEKFEKFSEHGIIF